MKVPRQIIRNAYFPRGLKNATGKKKHWLEYLYLQQHGCPWVTWIFKNWVTYSEHAFIYSKSSSFDPVSRQRWNVLLLSPWFKYTNMPLWLHGHRAYYKIKIGLPILWISTSILVTCFNVPYKKNLLKVIYFSATSRFFGLLTKKSAFTNGWSKRLLVTRLKLHRVS